MSADKIKQAIRQRDGNRCLLCGMTEAEHQTAYEETLPVHRIVQPTWEECKPAFVEYFGGPKETFASFGLSISSDGRLSRRNGRALLSSPDPKWPANISKAFKRYQQWRVSAAGYREDNCFTLCKNCHQDIHRIKDRLVADINQAFLFSHQPKLDFSALFAVTKPVEQRFTDMEFAIKDGRITGQMKELLVSWLRQSRQSRPDSPSPPPPVDQRVGVALRSGH